MAKYKATMIKTVQYIEEAIIEADDEFFARNIVCDMAVNEEDVFEEKFWNEEWDFVDAEEISD
jgi:hypothetical protein